MNKRNISRASRWLSEYKEETAVIQRDQNLYCVCQTLNDGSPYICCVICGQWYHPKCIDYNAVNNNIIMEGKYCCGYCNNNKRWPPTSSRPPLPVPIEDEEVTVLVEHEYYNMRDH